MSTQIIGFMVFLAFGSAIAAFFRKIGMWSRRAVGLGRTMTIRLKDGRTIEIKNVSIVISQDAARQSLQVLKRGLGPGDALPEDEVRKKTEEFLKKALNASRAQYAVNTFRAYARGFMKDLLRMNDKPSVENFDEIVSTFYGTDKQAGIPNLKEQLQALFSKCPPGEGEFLIGWADRVVMTDKRIIITSQGAQPVVEHEVQLQDIEDYTT
ncbi:MAG: hypothetical protein KGJ95_09340 [Candidatus Omnitrophica bacterium]|nr:hypothetical protein [Candidatus Omnitrophota bacterium]